MLFRDEVWIVNRVSCACLWFRTGFLPAIARRFSVFVYDYGISVLVFTLISDSHPSAFHHPIPSPCLNAVLSWSAVPRLSPPHTHLHISALSRTYGTVSHWLSVNDYLLPSVCLRIPLSRCAESEILHIGVVCSCCSFTLYWIWKVCSSCLVQFFIICSYTYSIH